MERAVVKKVRLTREEGRKLRQLASQRRSTESDVIRYGLRLAERMERRRRGLEGLIGLIEGPEPKKIRFELK